MGILGIGVDILHMPRLKQVISRRPDRFLTRILTKAELADLEKLKTELDGEIDHDRAIRFVGARYVSFFIFCMSLEGQERTVFVLITLSHLYRWALKEATYKALTPRLKLTWQDVTVYKDQGTVVVNQQGYVMCIPPVSNVN
jgi:holo-[acyl-carrier protein] synthase